uniref:Uncharacterized protein n=1 Tax=Lepeophtheirus salmonis TaxID=72036 RepID=A0A0K2TP36_LEPSM
MFLDIRLIKESDMDLLKLLCLFLSDANPLEIYRFTILPFGCARENAFIHE